MNFKNLLFIAVLTLTQGCLYTNIRVPREYRSATPSDVKADAADGRVSGMGCNRTALYLVAWGDASYKKATAQALKGHEGKVLYDVKSDVKVRSYLLGLYMKTCTIVTGKVGQP